MRRSLGAAFGRTHLGGAISTLVLVASSASAAPTLIVQDPLTQPFGAQQTVTGGSFSSAGWKRTGFDTKLVYDLGTPITAGRVRFEMDGVNGVNHGLGGFPDCRAIFAAVDNNGSGNIDDPGNESVQFLWAWAMEETLYCNGAPGGLERTNRMKLLVHGGAPSEPGEPMSDPLTWDGSQFYTYEIGWNENHAWLLRDGATVLDQGYPSAPVVMNLRYVFLGTVHRYKAGVKDATYRNLEVWDDHGPPPASDAGVPDADVDATADSGACLSAGPAQSGSGPSASFHVDYQHCEGGNAFRVVQLLVGDQVTAGAPSLNVGYEAGLLNFENQSCAPGENKLLTGAYGSLDCAATSVSTSGAVRSVTWALRFDTTKFAGTHKVFVDAKGGTGSPEPRLGWTELGTFTVSDEWNDAGQVDAGKPDSGTAANGSTELSDPGCGCRAPGARSPWLGAAVLALTAALAASWRRRRP